MKIVEELEKLGIELTDDQKTSVTKKFTEDVVSVFESDKKVAKVQAQLDNANELYQETLEKFKDIDPEKVKDEIAKYKKIAEDSEKNYKDELYKRDFDDALNKVVADIKFTSESAKRAFIADVKEQGFKLGENGTIYGLNDFYNDVKAKDPTAFVDEKTEEAEQQKAKFTTPNGAQTDDNKPATVQEVALRAAMGLEPVKK